MKHIVAMISALSVSVPAAGSAATNQADICVYGGTSGGVAAAVQAARMGKSVSLVVFNDHLGGMTSGGLGWTDYGNRNAIGGISREFYTRVGAKYGSGNPAWTFEPHVAETVFEEMAADEAIPVYTNRRLASVTMDGTNIVSIRMESGDVFRADMFIDATYEGDLLAMAGVSYTVGREANATYREPLNGVVNPPGAAGAAIDPYVVPGNPASGLLPYIQSGGIEAHGSADHRVQAYNFRLCLTTVVSNQLPVTAPAGYDPADYELFTRYVQAYAPGSLTDYLRISPIPNNKADINNAGFLSTDLVGQNWDYPDGDDAAREAIRQAHEDYTRGLLYYLGHDTNVPANVRSNMLEYGLCRDEFRDSGGWPHQLYVREARRMVADYVMTEAHCRGTVQPYDGVGLGSYTMDSHGCRRYVTAAGTVRTEGGIGTGVPAPYRIAYRALTPRREECGNLLVPWSLSASHVAFGSIRMEPVFMVLGQSAATAAVQAMDDGVPVQDVNVTNLQARLVADGQVVSWGAPANSRPLVELSSPRMGDVFPMHTNIVVSADAWDEDGTVTGVVFLANGFPIGEATAAPYKLVWSNTYPAELVLTARAHDDGGAVNESGAVLVRVGAPGDPGGAENGIVVDNADGARVTRIGTWMSSQSVPGYYGSNYIHDNNEEQGTKSVRFAPTLLVEGAYNTFLRFSMHANRATAVPVDVVHAGGTTTLTVDQTDTRFNGQWIFAGRYNYREGASGAVVVRNDGADGYVTADAVSFASVSTNAAPTNGSARVYEYFNNYGSNGLDRLSGLGGGGGWLSSWLNDTADTVSYNAGMQTAYDVSDYSDSGNLAGPSHGRALMSPGDNPDIIIRRSVAVPLKGTVWLSCLVRHEDNAVGDMRLWFDTVTPGNEADTFVGLREGDVPTMRYGGTELTGVDLLSARKDLLLLVKVVLDVSGAADSLSFWVRTEQDDIRTEAHLGPALLATNGVDILGEALTYIGLSGGSGMNANVDALRISDGPTAFQDVVEPVAWPELYSTVFPDPGGGLPAEWSVLEGAVGSPGWRVDGGGDLRYDGPVTNGITVYTGPLALGNASQITNGLVEATFRKSDGNLTGLVGRLQDAGNFYHARLQGRNQLEIYRFVDGQPTLLGGAATATDDFNAGETWRIRVAFRGATIMADLFNQFDELVARRVAKDAAFSSGFAGLRASNPTAYESFRVSGWAVPLPRDGMLILVR